METYIIIIVTLLISLLIANRMISSESRNYEKIINSDEYRKMLADFAVKIENTRRKDNSVNRLYNYHGYRISSQIIKSSLRNPMYQKYLYINIDLPSALISKNIKTIGRFNISEKGSSARGKWVFYFHLPTSEEIQSEVDDFILMCNMLLEDQIAKK